MDSDISVISIYPINSSIFNGSFSNHIALDLYVKYYTGKYSCTIYSAYTDADIDTYLYMIWYNNVFHAIEKAEGPNFFEKKNCFQNCLQKLVEATGFNSISVENTSLEQLACLPTKNMKTITAASSSR